MANQINVNVVAGKSGRRARSVATQNRCETRRSADAARPIFKGQCYDAEPASDTNCRKNKGRLSATLVFLLTL